MSFAYLDTQVAVYLVGGLDNELSREAKRAIDSSDLLLSPMVVFEFDYLFRKKRIGLEARSMMLALEASFGVSVCRIPFAAVALEAIDVDWTTDPFDRLIVAQAIANSNAKLITRDRLIRQNYPQAVW